MKMKNENRMATNVSILAFRNVGAQSFGIIENDEPNQNAKALRAKYSFTLIVYGCSRTAQSTRSV